MKRAAPINEDTKAWLMCRHRYSEAFAAVVGVEFIECESQSKDLRY
tara:strand:+ start:379 stop:516 length:138 start_codon:yes stop_codon:yes gene_type:complete